MQFATAESLIPSGRPVIKRTEIGGRFLDAWLSNDNVGHEDAPPFALTRAREGLWGQATVACGASPDELCAAARNIYAALFALLDRKPDFHLVRVWNYVPDLNGGTPGCGALAERYHHFNQGRFEAYRRRFGEDRTAWIVPAASVLGTADGKLTLEFFAASSAPVFLENPAQTPAPGYSRKYGPAPPLFARGVVFNACEQHVLISSGTAAIKGEESLHLSNVEAQFETALDNLRLLVGVDNLTRYRLGYGFDFGDLKLLRIYHRRDADRDALEKLARAAVPSAVKLAFFRADICRAELLVEIEGIFSHGEPA